MQLTLFFWGCLKRPDPGPGPGPGLEHQDQDSLKINKSSQNAPLPESAAEGHGYCTPVHRCTHLYPCTWYTCTRYTCTLYTWTLYTWTRDTVHLHLDQELPVLEEAELRFIKRKLFKIILDFQSKSHVAVSGSLYSCVSRHGNSRTADLYVPLLVQSDHMSG